mgnify:CR=1 FL=1
MKIWYVLSWRFRALLAEMRKLTDMTLTETFYLNAEAVRSWIEVNPETVSLDANNVQKAPLSIRFWMGEGSEKTALTAFLTLKVESVVGSSVTALYTYKSPAAVSSYSYTIPASSYPTANRISVYAYEDAARTKEIGSKQVNIVVENPVPFPRSEPWSTRLTYKNGEYLLLDDVIYMWSSRVPGNTTVSPKADLSSSTPSGKWKSYQNWPLLATNIALIKFGLIGSAVFKDEYQYSQQGKTVAGIATSDYRRFGTDDFIPNLMLDFETGRMVGDKCELSGSIKRGITIYESGASFQITPKSNIYVIKNTNAQNLVFLFISLGVAYWGTEFSIINGGSGIAKVAYGMENPFFLFKGKHYTYVKLNKPGDIVELVYSPVLSSLHPDTGGAAFIIRNKSDFKANADGVTLESI